MNEDRVSAPAHATFAPPKPDAQGGEVSQQTTLDNALTESQRAGKYNFTPGQSPSPYVTAGGGLYNVGSDTDSVTLPSIGGGVGLQFHVAGGHGTVRSEFRVDHFSPDESRGLLAVNAFGLKVGFDLWMK